MAKKERTPPPKKKEIEGGHPLSEHHVNIRSPRRCGNERLCRTADPAVVSFIVCPRFLPENRVALNNVMPSLAGHSHGGNGLRAAPGAEEAEARGDAPGGRAVRPRRSSTSYLSANPPSGKDWLPPGVPRTGRQLGDSSDQQRDDL